MELPMRGMQRMGFALSMLVTLHPHKTSGQEDIYANLFTEAAGLVETHHSGGAHHMVKNVTTEWPDLKGLKLTEPPKEIPEPLTTYLACAPPKPIPAGVTSREYIMGRLKNAAVYTEPYLFLHLCNFLPPKMYNELRNKWPPKKVMLQGREVTGIHNTAPEDRYKLSMFKLQDFGSKDVPKDEISKYAKLAQDFGTPAKLKAAQAVWKEFTDVVFSKEFEELLLKKLQLDYTPQGHDSRIQTDVAGYSVGVHADSVKKLLTMQLYFPEDDKPMYFYGTCVHTTKQYESRRKSCNGCSPCFKKFMFQANSGYTFPVHNESWHSAPNVLKKVGERRTALLNWYKIAPEKTWVPKGKSGRR